MARDRRKDDDDPLRREDLPGELEHASGEVDEAEAALVAGAGGEVSDVSDQELERQAAEAGRGARIPADERGGPRPGGNRALNFLRASWAELQRVQWPDRRHVTQATTVVIGFVALAGAYLGVADWAAQRVVEFII
ncbi:MAG TPA: preprotein translocase subunit SecE [Capillimicrobium sp.]|nr:preprotein translocase subunit SecE [Capillimicrobium sp.]